MLLMLETQLDCRCSVLKIISILYAKELGAEVGCRFSRRVIRSGVQYAVQFGQGKQGLGRRHTGLRECPFVAIENSGDFDPNLPGVRFITVQYKLPPATI